MLIRIHLTGKQIDYTRRIKKDMEFKVGVTMYRGSSEEVKLKCCMLEQYDYFHLLNELRS